MVILLTGVTKLLTKLPLFSTVPLYSKTLLKVYNFSRSRQIAKSIQISYFPLLLVK